MGFVLLWFAEMKIEWWMIGRDENWLMDDFQIWKFSDGRFPEMKIEWWMIADIYISISMETFGHRKYKIWGEGGNE